MILNSEGRLENPSRFLKFVKFTSNSEDCWEWEAFKNPNGYGMFGIGDKVMLSHRVSYFIFKGSLEDSLVVDHMCRNRACVNPKHLRLVSPKINATENSDSLAYHYGKRTHRKNGHEFTEDNITLAGGYRKCKICKREKGRIYDRAKALKKKNDSEK